MADEPNLLEPWQTDLDGMKDTDPFGTKLHEGLEYFLWKMSLPLTPSYNINADLKYSVRMYFHDSRGGICFNPFLNNAKTDYGDFRRNFEFLKHSNRGLELNPDKAVQDGEGNQLLSQEGYCFDLTPFIQSITLPPIGTTAATDVSTQLGTMKVGAYSPYSSDGGREITFQMIDTEYSILDAIFYPWLKMIGNAKQEMQPPTHPQSHRKRQSAVEQRIAIIGMRLVYDIRDEAEGKRTVHAITFAMTETSKPNERICHFLHNLSTKLSIFS